jgi:ARP2/3 complex ARPC3 (21 kDa) subunit
MFRNFSIESAADRTLIYLTFYTQQCLRELERVDDKQAGECALASPACLQLSFLQHKA